MSVPAPNPILVVPALTAPVVVLPSPSTTPGAPLLTASLVAGAINTGFAALTAALQSLLAGQALTLNQVIAFENDQASQLAANVTLTQTTLTAVNSTTMTLGGIINGTGLFRQPTYTVANLPTQMDPDVLVYASNGRKAGDLAGAGTGVFVQHQTISSLTGWYLVNTTTLVQA